MTQKHFKALAAALRLVKPEHTGEYDDGTTVGMMREREQQWTRTVDAIANVCADANPKFKRSVFEAAAGRPIRL